MANENNELDSSHSFLFSRLVTSSESQLEGGNIDKLQRNRQFVGNHRGSWAFSFLPPVFPHRILFFSIFFFIFIFAL